MKQILTLSLVSCLLACSSSKSTTSSTPKELTSSAKNARHHIYTYDYELIKPVEDTSLKYSDSSMDFTFTIGLNEINFTAKNKTDQPLKIVWDEASFIQFGKAGKVMHDGIKYSERNASMPVTTIPAHASIDDLILPTANVYYREGYYGTYSSTPGSWQEHSLFPFSDIVDTSVRSKIDTYKGEQISIYLPIRDTKSNELGYTFTFQVKDIHTQDAKL